ncbi:proline dehydrogenase 1, mitochondrial-like [Pollicipes pollicipes]|uniref:proline dehydrogenase 1, mitochondrial-like n=1 Tax=Pollicipes pollicipes TaxID=41117 RepID=UPI0018849E50|nr:proline dehydrogenase 1, mitochondrial-like [Pollicipes pollicipes]
MFAAARTAAVRGLTRPRRQLQLVRRRQLQTAPAAQLADPPTLDFHDPKQVFDSKSMPELVRALAVLKLCSLDWFVDNSLAILRRSERLLGERLLHRLISPLYSQFVPGTNERDLADVAAQLRRSGVRLVFAHMLEDDIGEGQTLASFLDANLATTLRQFGMVPREQLKRS